MYATILLYINEYFYITIYITTINYLLRIIVFITHNSIY
jgi:hypothetical protein